MDNKTMTPLIILAVVCVGAVLAVVFLWMDRAELERRNSELDSRVQELQRELESVKATAESLRAEMTQKVQQASQQAQQTAKLQQEIDSIRNPPEDRPTCFDSDAKYGADSIYIRGSVRAGNAQLTDHCRLGQLVEHTCIENPVGSGRFLVDSRIMNCPAGSRCVDGECLR
jgi:hypothetical protein